MREIEEELGRRRGFWNYFRRKELNRELEEATAEQLENFKKAFSVCLEAKDYLVKY